MAAPFVMGVVSALAPDSVIRASSDILVSAATRRGGFLSPATTMVRTTTGTVAVQEPLSALRSQRLNVVDLLKSGLQLCVAPNATPCVPVVGWWAGPMHAVPYLRHVTDWLVRHIALNRLIFWFFLGCLNALLVLHLLHKPRRQGDTNKKG